MGITKDKLKRLLAEPAVSFRLPIYYKIIAAQAGERNCAIGSVPVGVSEKGIQKISGFLEES